MKRFRWRLQRLLDLKSKQEEVLRGELVALMEKKTALKGRIMMLQAMLRSVMMEVQALPGSERIEAQKQFLEHVPVRDRQIAALNAQLNGLEQERRRKMDEMIRLRQFRKGLERLRTQAAAEHTRHWERQEQKVLDENAGQAYARRQVESQYNGGPGPLEPS